MPPAVRLCQNAALTQRDPYSSSDPYGSYGEEALTKVSSDGTSDSGFKAKLAAKAAEPHRTTSTEMAATDSIQAWASSPGFSLLRDAS